MRNCHHFGEHFGMSSPWLVLIALVVAINLWLICRALLAFVRSHKQQTDD